jgi:creatinine amidohydrolase
MRWEELTADQFPQAVAQAQGVCLLPLACLERHGHHLPLGTDMFIARELCRRAADIEPTLIFPDYVFTQILEARHCAGTIAIAPELMVSLLDNVCREIARNGLRKILFVNAHGGNHYLIRFFAQAQLASPRQHVIYVAEPILAAEDEAIIKAQWATTVDGHAGESETSMMLAFRPDLVHQTQIRDETEGLPLNRLSALRQAGAYVSIGWYADHPTHYRGDGRAGTAEKGERQLAARARALANLIRVIKQDQTTPQLQAEFFAASG